MPPRLVALEFLLSDLDRALELLVEGIGFTLVGRERHAVFDAEVAVVEAPPVAITLLAPTETGLGRPIPLPTDRMSQLVFELDDGAELRGLRDRLATAGVSAAHDGAETFHLATTFMEGLFGNAPTFVFTTAVDPVTSGAPAGPGAGDEPDPTPPTPENGAEGGAGA